MTRKECIAILRQELSNQVLDLLSTEIIEAMGYAADFMEARPERGPQRYYFTFGTDPLFPFGIEEFVEVYAETADQAVAKFNAAYPHRPGSNLVNCAFIYNEAKWEPIWKENYHGKRPIVVID